MRPLFLVILAVSALLVPGLCLSGAMAHACEDSPTDDACGHEEGCPEDPCGTTAVRPRSSNASHAPEFAFEQVCTLPSPLLVSTGNRFDFGIPFPDERRPPPHLKDRTLLPLRI